MKKYLAALVLILSCPSYAATYYFSDCGAGARASCKPGNDASLTPTNPNTPYKTVGKAFAIFRDAAAGDQILFAKGGSFDVIGENPIQNTRSTANNPIVIGSYQPKWYKGSQKPILNQTADTTLLDFTDGSTPEADGGYIVRDLYLKGSNPPSGKAHWGIFINQLASDITLDNLTIDGFQLGLYCGDDIPRITLKNSKLVNNAGAGILTSCDDITIENNTFDNNGYGHQFLDHQIYLSGSMTDGSSGAIVRNNKFTNSVHFEGPACTGAPIVGHGRIRDLLIEHNSIVETTAGSDGCWGISIDGGYPQSDGEERFSNVTIRDNLLVNVGNTGISCSSCDNWTIENNVLVWQFRSDAYGIGIPSNDMNAGTKLGDYPTTHVTIRNNSLYYKTSNRDAIAIKTAEQGNFTISSNLIFFGDSTNGAPRCFDTTNRSIANFDDFTNNLCYGKSGTQFSQQFASQSAAQAADSKWNTYGLTGNPKLLKAPAKGNDYTMALKPDSPAINAGDIPTCSTTAFGGDARVDRCDIGAYEYVAP